MAKRKQTSKTPQRPRVALYRRVSTDRQADEGGSLELQLERCLGEADRRFGPNLYDYVDYCDDGYSGSLGLRSQSARKSQHRPRLSDLVEDIEAGKIDTVIAYRLDRLFRSVSLASHMLNDVFDKYDVGLISVVENIDASTPQGKAMIHVMIVMAEYFLDWMSENICEALAKLKRDGRFVGRPPFGWRRLTEEEKAAGILPDIVPDEDQGRWVAQMKDWFLSGWGMPRIAEALHEAGVQSPAGKDWWREGTVRKVLNNPFHCGKMHLAEGVLIDIVGIEPYYSEAVYYQIRELFKQRADKGPATVAAVHYLLNDALKCKHCGGPMRGRRHNQRGQLYYRCVSKGGQRTKFCSGNSKQTDLIDGCVLAAVHRFAERPDMQEFARPEAMRRLGVADAGLRQDVKQLKGRIEVLQSEIDRWSAQFRESALDPDVFIHEANRLQEERRGLGESLVERTRQLSFHDTRVEQQKLAIERLASFAQVWERLNLEERRELVGSVVEQVSVGKMPKGDTEVEVKLRLGSVSRSVIPKLHGAKRELSLQQLAHLELAHRGLSDAQIAEAWQVTIPRVRSIAGATRRKLNVADLETAYQQQRETIELYLEWLPLQATRKTGNGGERKTCLTEAQQQILQHRARGHRGPAIAVTLGITPGAVYKHLHDIRVRLGVDTDDAAVAKAAQWGLVDLEQALAIHLTPRESAYLYLLSTGSTDEEIAAAWEVSAQGVTHHRNAVTEKAQCASVEQLLSERRELVPQHAYGLPIGPLANRKRQTGELSEKTLTVLRLKAEGFPHKQIAAQCGIRECSVDHHLRRAKKLLQVAATADAIEEARRRGLIG